MSYTPTRIRSELVALSSAFDELRSRLRGQGRRPETDQKRRDLRPIVTVFGAGIAGLSAAHELIERGFDVQVVEPSGSPNDEYAVEVGGLACNQFGRVPENPRVLHANSKDDAETFRRKLELISQLRSDEMQPVQRRFGIPWRILFRPGSSEVEDQLTDEWGISNAVKLHSAWETIRRANQAYGNRLTERLTEQPPNPNPHTSVTLDPPWIARESLLVEVRGHTSDDGSEPENRALSCERALEVIKYFEQLDQSIADDGSGFRRSTITSRRLPSDRWSLSATSVTCAGASTRTVSNSGSSNS